MAQVELTKNTIVAGKSLGNVSLGDSSQAVRKVYGQPTKTYDRGPGIKEDYWNWSKSDANEEYDELRVIYASDKVIQVKAVSPRFVLSGGFTTNNTLAQVLQKYKNLKLSVFGVEDLENGGGYEAYFYDDAKSGVAFMVGTQDYFDHSAHISAIYVHRPNTFVMPDVGSTPATAKLNKPFILVNPVKQPKPKPKPKPSPNRVAKAPTLKKIRLTNRQRQAAVGAIRVLRRLESATKVGLSYYAYVNRVVDAQADVDEYLRVLPQSSIRSELEQAMNNYGIAARGWNSWIEGFGSRGDEGIPEVARFHQMMFNLQVGGPWSLARQHTQNAANLL